MCRYRSVLEAPRPDDITTSVLEEPFGSYHGFTIIKKEWVEFCQKAAAAHKTKAIQLKQGDEPKTERLLRSFIEAIESEQDENEKLRRLTSIAKNSTESDGMVREMNTWYKALCLFHLS